MKIGIDMRLWDETGVGRYIRNLVSELEKIDKKNEYVLFTKNGIQNSEFRIQNKNWRLARADIQWHSIEEQIKFAWILNRENLDLVHFPYFSVPIFYNKPFVVTIHDLILHHFPTGEASTLTLPLYYLKRFGYKFVISQAAMKAKKIITVSNATKGEIIDHLKVQSEKVVVTYEGIDKIVQSSEFRVQSSTRNYFLYVGNAYPHKNLGRLLESFRSLVNETNGLRLILVGKENYFYRKLKRRVKEMGLTDTVVFRGYVSDYELSSLYKSALATICPSLMEGFGLPGLEAMANNCLVLASDIAVHNEIYKDAAVYFNANDPKDLEEKMVLIYSNYNNYKSYIKKGLDIVKVFSWEKMARETLAIYENSPSTGSG